MMPAEKDVARKGESLTTVEQVRIGGHRVGLPEGVFLAPLGRRLGAFAIDALIPYVLVIAGLLVGRGDGPGWLAMILYVVAGLWLILLLVMVALRAAGPGMQLLGLQVVGMQDGRPIGFGRALLRAVILAVLLITGIGLIILSTAMLVQARRQGWHDRAADSVVITERPLAPPRPAARSTTRSRGDASTDSGESAPGDRVDLVEDGVDAAGPSLPDPDQYWAERREQQQERDQPQPTAESTGADEEEPAAQPSGEDQLVPAVGAESAPAAPADTSTPTQDSAPEDDSMPADQGWVVVLEDGREIAVQRLVLVGRNPQPHRGEEDARLIKIMDEARTVSKTHLSVSVDADGVAVTDRGSTNGSAITAPDGGYELLTPEQPRRLSEPGYLVSFGKHHIRIGRHV